MAARPTGFVATVEKPINDDVLVVEVTVTDPTYYDGPQRRTAYYQLVPATAWRGVGNCAAASAYWMKGSVRRISLRSM